MSDFSPTNEQLEIVAGAKRSTGNILVEAGAGCAKTSTLKLAAKGIRVPALALAFNKRNSVDLEKALPGHFVCKSMNALGHGAWARSLPSGTKIVLEDRKIGKLVTSISKEHKLKMEEDDWGNARQLVSRAMTVGLIPSDVAGSFASLVDDTPESWADLADDIGIWPQAQQQAIFLARLVLSESIRMARKGIICFDDQIYCSTLLGGKFTPYPVVFGDEDQDFSPLQIAMISASVAPHGRLFAVGDKRQGIYAWRGALGDAAKALQGRVPGLWTEYPLMTTFRCPHAVVERQQSHVPGFRAHVGNRAGTIHSWRAPFAAEAAAGYSWTLKDLMEAKHTPDASMAILCRNNGPLLTMAFGLIRRGVGVVMLGREIGKGLISLASKICPEDSTPIDLFLGLVGQWEAKETELALAADKEEKLAGIVDRAECLRAVASGAQCVDAGQVRRQLDFLFSKETGQVTLSSIHRSKGSEWDLVLHLDPWRVPSTQAKKAAQKGNTLPLEQEYNLRYVCETRAKDTLIMASLDDFR